MSRRIILPEWIKDLKRDMVSANGEISTLKDQVNRLKLERGTNNTFEQRSNGPRPISASPRYELDSQVYTIEKPLTPQIRPGSNSKIKPRKSLPSINPTISSELKDNKSFVENTRPISATKVLNSSGEIVSLENLKNHL